MSKIGMYAGSFDPMTRGHLDILIKAIKTFDTMYVSVGVNSNKSGFFDIKERIELIRSSIQESKNPSLHFALLNGKLIVSSYEGMSLIQYAKAIGATHIVRGLRQSGDFNDEFALTGIAGHLDSNVIFTHFICQEQFLHVSSSTARELAGLDEDISWLVTPSVEKALKARV